MRDWFVEIRNTLSAYKEGDDDDKYYSCSMEILFLSQVIQQ